MADNGPQAHTTLAFQRRHLVADQWCKHKPSYLWGEWQGSAGPTQTTADLTVIYDFCRSLHTQNWQQFRFYIDLLGLVCSTSCVLENLDHQTYKLPMASPFKGSQNHPFLGPEIKQQSTIFIPFCPCIAHESCETL